MIFASTSSVYAGHTLPFNENMSANTPTSTYAATKKAAETLCCSYHVSHGLDITIVRYFTVYGPAGRPDMSYFKFIQAVDKGEPLTIFGDGSQLRDFSYIEDIAKGTIKAMKNVGFEIVNLGGGNGTYSLLDMIGMIEERLRKKAILNFKPFEKADMKETFADISKAKQLLDWQPTISFEQGISNCVDWYLAHKNWASLIQ
jgi:UDP-glucuronate 4-epimerase